MGIWLSVALVTLCAICWDVGVVLQKRASDEAPTLELKRGLWASVKALLISPYWLGGFAFSAIGWLFFSYALTFTPISLARALQGTGLVLLALFSIVFLKHRPTPREWMGVAIVTAGVLAVGLSEGGTETTHSTLRPVGLATTSLGLLGLGAVAYQVRARLGRGLSWLVVFSMLSGMLAGLGDVFTKGLVMELDHGTLMGALARFVPFLVAVYLPGILFLSAAYQHGSAIVVVGISDFTARVTTIAAGVVGMGESFPSQSPYFELRLVGLAVVLWGTVLLARFSGDARPTAVRSPRGA